MADIIDFNIIDEHGAQTYRGSWEFSVAELDRDEVADPGQVTIEAEADKTETRGEYEMDGTVTFTADLTCSRCAEPYPFASNSPFHVRFRPRPEVSAENAEVEITDSEELDVEFYTDRGIPLKELALEQIQLSIPMKPLCDEKCLGLCPTCGANRMQENCRCENAITDERWGALKDFREQLAKKKNV